MAKKLVIPFFIGKDARDVTLRFAADGSDRFFGVELPAFTLEIVLPVGISFYTFQTLSYSIDIYRGQLKPTRSLVDFAAMAVSQEPCTGSSHKL